MAIESRQEVDRILSQLLKAVTTVPQTQFPCGNPTGLVITRSYSHTNGTDMCVEIRGEMPERTFEFLLGLESDEAQTNETLEGRRYFGG